MSSFVVGGAAAVGKGVGAPFSKTPQDFECAEVGLTRRLY